MAEPTRMCDSCGQVDDHPRHVWHHGNGDGKSDVEVGVKALAAAGKDQVAYEMVLRHLKDDYTFMKHMDCCRAEGCPDGSCNEVTKGAETKTGDALRRHIKKGSN
jgi:hypothetical protein